MNNYGTNLQADLNLFHLNYPYLMCYITILLHTANFFYRKRKNYPLCLLHNLKLQALGGIVICNFNCFLHYDFAAVGDFVYKVSCCTCYLNSFFKSSLVNFKSVKTVAAKRRNKGGVNVYNFFIILFNKAFGKD